MQRRKIKWNEGWIPAAVLVLMLLLCLLIGLNRLPRKITEAPVHAVSVDLFDAARMNLNSATADELMQLPSVGEVLAGRIIAARPFSSVDDLLRVEGIGEKLLEEIRPCVKTG